jgi:hypothetical protein
VSPHREQVAAALDAVAIRGPMQYAWLGRRSRLPPAALRAELDAPARRAHLLSCLREELYWSFYCRGEVVQARWGEPEPSSADASLVRALAAANAASGGGWEPGWTVERTEGEDAVAVSPRLRVRVPAAACRGTVAPGAAISLPVPKDLPALSPGFFSMVGDAGDEVGAGVVRVYWHVTRAGAPALVRALTARLNAETLRFRLKVVDHPLRFDRCDAAVLYLRARDLPPLRGTLASVAAALGGVLRRRVPAFTLALAPGVGLAEDDGAGESFGVRRCALLAAGILEAHELRAGGGAERLQAVAARFARDGVDIDAPYLEPALAGRHVL